MGYPGPNIGVQQVFRPQRLGVRFQLRVVEMLGHGIRVELALVVLLLLRVDGLALQNMEKSITYIYKRDRKTNTRVPVHPPGHRRRN